MRDCWRERQEFRPTAATGSLLHWPGYLFLITGRDTTGHEGPGQGLGFSGKPAQEASAPGDRNAGSTGKKGPLPALPWDISRGCSECSQVGQTRRPAVPFENVVSSRTPSTGARQLLWDNQSGQQSLSTNPVPWLRRGVQWTQGRRTKNRPAHTLPCLPSKVLPELSCGQD